MRRSRKPLSVVRRIEGSNPSPSAWPGGSLVREPLACGCARFSNRRTQSTEVHGRLQASTGLMRHWRTTGASGRRSSFSRETAAAPVDRLPSGAKKSKPGDLSVLGLRLNNHFTRRDRCQLSATSRAGDGDVGTKSTTLACDGPPQQLSRAIGITSAAGPPLSPALCSAVWHRETSGRRRRGRVTTTQVH
jgi:hypothetical protein